MDMKHGWGHRLEMASLWIDLLIYGVPGVLLMLFAIWLVWRAFGNW
jgi:hypothetical protein